MLWRTEAYLMFHRPGKLLPGFLFERPNVKDAKCAACGKTAYPLESIQANDTTYHKGCFKCVVCRMSLSLNNFKVFDGKTYCVTHTPTVKATQVADDAHVTQALNAPKRNLSEGARGVQKGTGDRVQYGLDSIATKNALNAPKRQAESIGNVQKGTGGGNQYGIDAIATKNALNAPKRQAESIGTVQKGTGEKPTAGPVFGAEADAAPAQSPYDAAPPADYSEQSYASGAGAGEEGGYEEQYEEGGYEEGGYEEQYYEEEYYEEA